MQLVVAETGEPLHVVGPGPILMHLLIIFVNSSIVSSGSGFGTCFGVTGLDAFNAISLNPMNLNNGYCGITTAKINEIGQNVSNNA